ncbi:MAG: hypothetical protein U9R47_00775 [Actinomycetota bacterium]|nr:hypothetical protein [Actinomycetota bacterium]
MMKPRIAIAMGSMLAFVALGACSSGAADTAVTTTIGDDVVSTTILGGSGSSDTTATAPAETTTTTTATTTTVVDVPAIAGAELIEQTTPASGGGTRPLLEWVPVEGAATYIVVVYTETGGSYWSAVTSETSTYVGGPLQIPAGRTGPNVADGYTWVVYADDAEGNLLAVSPQRPISP